MKIKLVTSVCFIVFVFANSLQADTNVGGDINGNVTWTLANSPYIVTSNIRTGSPTFQGGGTLTIDPGVVVKVCQSCSITVGYIQGTTTYLGRIIALGTAAAPIQIIANSATPTKTFWPGIFLQIGISGSPSQFAFVTIKHASQALKAHHLGTGAIMPIVHHCTFDTNNLGLNTNWIATSLPVLYQNNFINNGTGTSNWGMTNNTTGGSVESRFCWWNAATGPSLTGGGTAQRITAGIIYDPWLTGVSSSVHYFVSGSVLNRIFNPNIGANFKLQFTSNQSGNWTVKFINSSSQVVRTITGSGASANVSWDGKNDGGTLQPNGNYTYTIESTSGPDIATPATGNVTLDTNRQLTITSFTATPTLFSASTTLSGAVNFDDPTWTLTFRNSVNTVVKNASGSNSPMTFVWDGKDNSGTPVPDGAYTAQLQYTTGISTVSSTVNLTKDATQPTTVIHSPVAGTISNIYNNGSFNFPIVITANDPNGGSWTLKTWRSSPCCTPQSDVATGPNNKVNYTAYTWQTIGLVNGNQHTFQLRATDNAGNSKTVNTIVTIGNLNLTRSATQFNTSTGATVTFTSVVPFALTQTILIKNKIGQTVRTLVNNVSRSAAGNYNDVWNGQNDQSILVPEGPYFYVSQVQISGGPWYTLDWTNIVPTVYDSVFFPNVTGPHDPFFNIPLTMTYSLPVTCRLVISIGPNHPPLCNPPDWCPLFYEYKQSGNHTFKWAGVDNTGLLRTDAKSINFTRYGISPNVVVAFGTKPVISNFALTPAVFNALSGQQNIGFTLATYQSQPVTVTATILNQQSLSVLRTVTQTGVAPGTVSIPWNGRADNGMLLAPGPYTVTLTVEDARGDRTTEQLLMSIRY